MAKQMKLNRMIPAHRKTQVLTWIRLNWLTHQGYVSARTTAGLPYETDCFWCRTKFEDDTQLAIAGRPKGKNVLLCPACAHEAIGSKGEME